jgi:uncharacterized protein
VTGKHAATLERPTLRADSPRAEALRQHRTELLELVRSYGGHDVHVFGSVARGTDHDGSDIDLVFLSDRPLSLLGSLSLHRAARQLLGHRVDLFSVPELPEATLDQIAVDAVLL